LRHIKEPWEHIPCIIWPPFLARTAGCGRERHLAAKVGTLRKRGIVQ
jgi:hypothetical protein